MKTIIIKLAKNENVISLISTFAALGVIALIIVLSVYLNNNFQAY